MKITKCLIRKTYENGYPVLDAYRYMLRIINLESKTTLKVYESGKSKYFFVTYEA